jgi:DNA polymerase-4
MGIHNQQMKKIIHIDMDAFYASVEQRDFPELRGKPIAVGWSTERGVVTTASYEARKFGVRSAMASKIALRICPDLIFAPPRFEVYHQVSLQIRDIFTEYTDLVEPLSLDEAFLDVTENKKNIPSATLIAREIKARIKEKTGLTASAGISINKFLAKIASDINKPDGLFLIPPEKAVEFVEKLPIEKFFGIGKVTAEKMHQMGIKNGFDLKQLSESELISQFGKTGKYYYLNARAEDPRDVNPNRVMKSLGAENTFPQDLKDPESIENSLDEIADILIHRMDHSGTRGKTLTLKVKYADFHQITRSKTLSEWISGKDQVKNLYMDLLNAVEIGPGIRLLGLTLSNLNQSTGNISPDLSDSQLTLDL